MAARVLDLTSARAARHVPCPVVPLESASDRRIREARRRRAEQAERAEIVRSLILLGSDTPTSAAWLSRLTLSELRWRVAEFRRDRLDRLDEAKREHALTIADESERDIFLGEHWSAP